MLCNFQYVFYRSNKDDDDDEDDDDDYELLLLCSSPTWIQLLLWLGLKRLDQKIAYPPSLGSSSSADLPSDDVCRQKVCHKDSTTVNCRLTTTSRKAYSTNKTKPNVTLITYNDYNLN